MQKLGSIVPLFLGIFFLCYSYQHTLGNMRSPAPGLWPFILSLVIVMASILLFIDKKNSVFEPFTKNFKKVLLGIFSVALFIITMNFVGLLPSSIVFLLFWIKYLGEEPWKISVIVSVSLSITMYVLFVILLGIPFPETILGGM